MQGTQLALREAIRRATTISLTYVSQQYLALRKISLLIQKDNSNSAFKILKCCYRRIILRMRLSCVKKKTK